MLSRSKALKTLQRRYQFLKNAVEQAKADGLPFSYDAREMSALSTAIQALNADRGVDHGESSHGQGDAAEADVATDAEDD